MHLEYAGTYIHQQSQLNNPFGRGGSTITGTGGTPFMKYLKKHCLEQHFWPIPVLSVLERKERESAFWGAKVRKTHFSHFWAKIAKIALLE